MSEGIQESLLVLRKSPDSINFCEDFSTVTLKSYIIRLREGGFMFPILILALFLKRNSDAA